MFLTSERFDQAVLKSHQVVSRVEIITPFGQVLAVLPVESGHIPMDGDAALRSRGNIIIHGDHAPSNPTDLMHPLTRHEAVLWRGIRFEDGTEEYVPIARLMISRLDIQDSRENYSITVGLKDRAHRIQQARLHRNHIVEAGQPYHDAIRDLIEDRVPDLYEFDFAETNIVTGHMVFGGSGDTAGGDPWQYAQEMATNIGHRLYFDRFGIIRLVPEPDVDIDPIVWEYSGMILSGNRILNEEEVRNQVVVEGESTDNEEPVRVIAEDDDPRSPTFVGTYGAVPSFFRSSQIRTETQAELVANAQLKQVLGIEENVRITTVVHPGHEPFDVVRVNMPRSNTIGRFMIKSFTMPLSYTDALTLSMFSRRELL